MQITKLYIHDFQQFRDFELDFTDPNTGSPLERVCLIGRNGTGKSTLLSLLSNCLNAFTRHVALSVPASFGIRVQVNEDVRWLSTDCTGAKTFLADASDDRFEKHIRSGAPAIEFPQVKGETIELKPPQTPDSIIFCPADDPFTDNDLPSTRLDNALQLFKKFPSSHVVGGLASANFWNLLIYHVKKREADWQAFLSRPENSSRMVGEVQAQFDQEHPEILKFLADKWDAILEPAGLAFDYENAKKPVQLNENLEAYVKLLSGEILNYGALSSGIRNYLFKIGHIAALYFGRQVKSGFLFVDEPENSLYPDFLYDLIGTYQSLVHNTQFFVATHNPIIAAQFKPEERFILDFDEEHKVTVRRGVTPEGDDPNDILEKDFAVRSLYGPAGIRNWERFLDLRGKIQTETDAVKKKQLMSEFLTIGNDYNFALKNAIPEKAS